MDQHYGLSQNVEVEREPEGEAMGGDRNNAMVDRLLSAEMSFPSQGVWAQPEGQHEELRYLTGTTAASS